MVRARRVVEPLCTQAGKLRYSSTFPSFARRPAWQKHRWVLPATSCAADQVCVAVKRSGARFRLSTSTGGSAPGLCVLTRTSQCAGCYDPETSGATPRYTGFILSCLSDSRCMPCREGCSTATSSAAASWLILLSCCPLVDPSQRPHLLFN